MAKPFKERLIIDHGNLKILHENRQKLSGLTVFKSSFLGQIWNNVKTNWLMLLFCLPAMAWIIISQVPQFTANSTIPYSANIGIGYPIVNDAHIVGAMRDFQLEIRRALILFPLIIVASVGLAGVFNVVKYFCWGFKIKIVKTFFRGVKNSFAPFIWVGMMLGVCFLLLTYVTNAFAVYDVSLILRITVYALVIILCYFVVLLSLYITTQATVFNLTLFEILKNSLLLSTKFILQNSMIALIGLLSMLLPFLSFHSVLAMIGYVLFFMLAFSYTATVFTIYTQYVYDLMYEDKSQKVSHRVKNQNAQKAAVSGVTEVVLNEDEREKSTIKPVKPFTNPKKKRKY